MTTKINRREALKRTALLSGAALSSSLIAGIMQGCQPSQEVDWTPAFFTPEQADTMAEMAETILPRTDTPGAKDVFVHRFIDAMVGECYTSEEQAAFQKGLEELTQKCTDETGKPFAKLTAEERLAFLNAENEWALTELAKPPAERQDAQGQPFFIAFKQMVISGYFTSETVGEQVLAYKAIPGDYVGCVDLDTVGKAWAL